MENINNLGENIGEVVNKTEKRFTIDEKNLEVVQLKNMLKIPLEKPLPDGVAGFINAYRNVEEMKDAVAEAHKFISGVEKIEKGDYENLEASEIIALGIVPDSATFISEWNALKAIDHRKHNENNPWFKAGLGKSTLADVSKPIEKLKEKFNQKKEVIEAKAEYEQSIITDYSKKYALLDSFNLPEGYTKESMTHAIETAQKETKTLLQRNKAA